MDRIAEKNSENDRVLNRMVLTALLKDLGEQEQQIILKRYFENKTQTVIASELGISQVPGLKTGKKDPKAAKGADAGIIKQSLCILGIKGKKERPMKHGLQIFASAMFFAVIVFMVWIYDLRHAGSRGGTGGDPGLPRGREAGGALSDTVYIKISQSTEVHEPEVRVKDIAQVHCRNKAAEAKDQGP